MNFNAEGNQLATVSMAPDYMLTIWDWETEQMGLHSKAFGQDVWNVQFSLDDSRRLTTSGIGHIRFWKMAATFTGLKLQGSIGKFGKIDLSDIEHFVELPDGKVISGTEEGSLLLWEGNFIKCRFTLFGGKPCHNGTITYLAFDREEKCVVSASLDGLVKWWDFTAIDAAEVDSDHSMDFELYPLAEYAMANGAGIKAVIDTKILADSSRLFVALDVKGQAHTVTFNTLEQEGGTAGRRRRSKTQIRLCDSILSMQEKQRKAGGEDADSDLLVDGDNFVVEKHTFGRSHSGAIVGMDSCPVDHLAATCGVDGVVRCVDYIHRKEVAYRVFEQPCSSLRWLDTNLDRSGASFAVGFADGVVRVLSIGMGSSGYPELLRRLVFKPHNAAVTEISFSDSGALVATAGRDGTVFFQKCRPITRDSAPSWEPIKFINVATMSGKANVYCDSISWSPNEKYILASCTDGIVREVDLSSMLGLSFQSSEEEEVTFEVQLPFREIVTNVTVLGGSKSGIFSIVKETASSQEPAPAENTAADGTATAEGGAAPAAPAAPESPTKVTRSNTAAENKVTTSVVPLKLSKTIYARSKEVGSFYSAASLSGNQHMFIEGDINKPDFYHDMPVGLFSTESKDFLRPPAVLALRYSWSKKFLLLAAGDGSTIIRPVDFPDIFARNISNNGSAQAQRYIAHSFDDRFVLTAGNDGLLAVYKSRLDLIQQRAEPLFKDIDAGVYGKDLVKPPPYGAIPPEPRYLTFVSGVHASTEDNLFDPALTAKKPEVILEKELFSEEEAADIAAGAYSIQDNRLKLEEDSKKTSADELKTRIRASVRALRKDYEKVLKENETIPEKVRLTSSELEVDGEYFTELKHKGLEMLEEVHKECAFEAEKAERLLEKIKNRLMNGLLVDEMPLCAFDFQARSQPKSMVLSLRAGSLDPKVVDIIQEVKSEVHKKELQDSRQRSNEQAQKRAMDAMDEMKTRLHNKEEDGVEGKILQHADKHAELDLEESTAVARRKNRKGRKDELSRHNGEKPNENDDDIRDLDAIRHAEKTIGDYKLKCSDDYEVPEDQRINVVKKIRQMAMLEESMLTMRLQFNDRFLALRQLKREIIFSVRRDNQRIREIDGELAQEKLSMNLWEPQIDPTEYPDDYEEVTVDELNDYIKQRETVSWENSVAPVTKVVTGFKTSIVKNVKTGNLEVKKLCKDIAPVRTDRSQLDNLMSDPSIMDATPERTDPPKFYEIDECLLSAYTKYMPAEEAKKVHSLEDQIPSLRFAKSLLKQRMQSASLNSLQKKANAQRRRELEFERSMLLKKIEDNVNSFKEAVDELRVDRHQVLADLKLAELKLLTLYQEYKLLQTFEARDFALQQKQVRCKGEESEIYGLSFENKSRLEGKLEEIQHWNEKLSQIQLEFKSLLPDNHPYLETLTKIFKKKIKRSKGGEDENEEDDMEEEEEEEDDEDDEEVEDICPPGCDQIVFEKILDLREKKLDTEDVCSEIQKSIDDLKRTGDRLKQREKQIAKEAQQTEMEVRLFQLQKQAALNQIRIVVPLQMSQIYMFETSGCLTGPTDKPQSNNSEDLLKRIAIIKDAERRALVTQIDMKSHSLFSKK